MNKDRKFFIIDNTGVFTQEYINNVEKYTNYIKSNNIVKVFCNNYETEYILKSLIYGNCFYNKSDCVVEYKTDQELEKYLEENDNFLYNYRQKKQMSDQKNFKIAMVGNPPYQGEIKGFGRSASAIWYKFLLPFYTNDNIHEMCEIFPSRFLFGTGKGVSEFTKLFLTGKYVKNLVIYPNSTSVFPDVQIAGGVCYAYFNKNVNTDETKENLVNIKVRFGNYVEQSTRPLSEKGRNSFILYNNINKLINKIYNETNSFSNIVSSRCPFGLGTNFYEYLNYSENKTNIYNINVISYKDHKRINLYINENEFFKNEKIKINSSKSIKDYYNKYKKSYKICFPKAKDHFLNIKSFPIKKCLRNIFVVLPEEIVSDTYLCIPCENEKIMNNIISYMNTKFFNALIYTKSMTQCVCKDNFEYIPLQDFSQEWTDKKLYDLYKPLFEEKEYNEIWNFINLLTE